MWSSNKVTFLKILKILLNKAVYPAGFYETLACPVSYKDLWKSKNRDQICQFKHRNPCFVIAVTVIWYDSWKSGVGKCELTYCQAANQEHGSGRWKDSYTHVCMPNDFRTYVWSLTDVVVCMSSHFFTPSINCNPSHIGLCCQLSHQPLQPASIVSIYWCFSKRGAYLSVVNVNNWSTTDWESGSFS